MTDRCWGLSTIYFHRYRPKNIIETKTLFLFKVYKGHILRRTVFITTIYKIYQFFQRRIGLYNS